MAFVVGSRPPRILIMNAIPANVMGRERVISRSHHNPMAHRARSRRNAVRAFASMEFVVTKLVRARAKLVAPRKKAAEQAVHAVRLRTTKIPTMNATSRRVRELALANSTMVCPVHNRRTVCRVIASTASVAEICAPTRAKHVRRRKRGAV